MSILSEIAIYLTNNLIAYVPSHSMRLLWYRSVMRFVIGDDTSILMRCRFDTLGRIDIGKNTVINDRCRLDNRGRISIGENVSISSEVIIFTASHDYNTSDFAGTQRAVTVKDYAWIGSRAIIMPGVTIGEGAVIGAGSIVTKSIPDYAVAHGNPAKVYKNRMRGLDYRLSYRRKFQ